MEFKATIKQCVVKNGAATIQLDAAKVDDELMEVFNHSGESVFVTLVPEQQTISINDETGEVYR